MTEKELLEYAEMKARQYLATLEKRRQASKRGGKKSAEKRERGRVKLRARVIEFLGGRCASPDCRWLNPDGTKGCSDPALLDIDHIDGNGFIEREEKSTSQILKGILAGAKGYQLLCCNCHRVKTRAEVLVRVEFRKKQRTLVRS